mmetsp:Transcript_4976/g.14156  ORF Transcript_4976/g.14156 Transcript_4976/m.14156 type:complete len:342 (+) Transcript_4976:45-1070(+)
MVDERKKKGSWNQIEQQSSQHVGPTLLRSKIERVCAMWWLSAARRGCGVPWPHCCPRRASHVGKLYRRWTAAPRTAQNNTPSDQHRVPRLADSSAQSAQRRPRRPCSSPAAASAAAAAAPRAAAARRVVAVAVVAAALATPIPAGATAAAVLLGLVKLAVHVGEGARRVLLQRPLEPVAKRGVQAVLRPGARLRALRRAARAGILRGPRRAPLVLFDLHALTEDLMVPAGLVRAVDRLDVLKRDKAKPARPVRFRVVLDDGAFDLAVLLKVLDQVFLLGLWQQAANEELFLGVGKVGLGRGGVAALFGSSGLAFAVPVPANRHFYLDVFAVDDVLLAVAHI